MLRQSEASEVWDRLARLSAEPKERAEIHRCLIELNPDYTSAWLITEIETGFHLVRRYFAKGRFELNMTRDAIRLEHEIVTAIVDLRLEYFELRDSAQPESAHDFTDEEVFNENLSMR